MSGYVIRFKSPDGRRYLAQRLDLLTYNEITNEEADKLDKEIEEGTTNIKKDTNRYTS